MVTPIDRSRLGPWSESTVDALTRLDGAGLRLRRNQSLAPFTTYRVGGPAAGFLEVSSVAELEAVHEVVVATAIPVLPIGKGSNLLIADRGFDGLVLVLTSAFDEIAFDQAGFDEAGNGAVLVRLGAATLLPIAARATVRAGLTGFEWAVGVPGSVGGAVMMNAGGHGADMAASLRRVSVFDLGDGGPKEWTIDQLRLGYRTSALGPNALVLYAELALVEGDRAVSQATLAEIVRWRRQHQPGGSNAGSVFANPAHSDSPDGPDGPESRSAGELIDDAGLKGFRWGTAAVSTKHANFIQTDPDGAADDVYHLIRHVQAVVRARTGIDLQPENRLVGFLPDPTELDREPV